MGGTADALLEHEGVDPSNQTGRRLAWVSVHRPEMYVGGAAWPHPERRVCVFALELEDGTWGGGARVMRLPDINEMVFGGGTREAAEEVLAAYRRELVRAAMSELYRTLRYQRDGDIGTLTLARPGKRNAQNPLIWEELGQLGAELLADQTLRCLVVTGEGPTFSAGIDLVEGMAGMLADSAGRTDDKDAVDAGLAAATTFSWIPQLGCASIAAVRGHAYGAGLQLALACDFRIFAKSTKVGLLEMRFGIMPDMGATVRLPRIVGESRARELILLGDVIDAGEALRIGLANRVVAEGDLDAAVAELADRLAAQPPIALRGARRAIDVAWHQDPDESLRFALGEQLRCLGSEDFREGVQAMVEGRTPQWKGR